MRQFFAAIMAGLISLSSSHADEAKHVRVLIITGDAYSAHKWKETTAYYKEILSKAGHTVDVTETPSKDLTPEKLAKYDVLLLNYTNTPDGAKANPASVWTPENRKAFIEAVQNGKGLVVCHHASASFARGNDADREFEKAIAGGWRAQGNHGKMHEFMVTVRKDHPITHGIKEFKHGRDELYQNSLLFPNNEVLATAFSEKSVDPKNTGKDEAVIWVATFGKGRVCENVLGHDLQAMKSEPYYPVLLIRGVEWAGTGQATYPLPIEK